jgi:hypothetical protein
MKLSRPNFTAISLSVFASAHEGHDQMMQMDQSVQQNILMETSSPVDHSEHQPELKQVPSDIQHDTHDHHREHGGQIYQATAIKNAWIVDDDGRGSAQEGRRGQARVSLASRADHSSDPTLSSAKPTKDDDDERP